MDENHHWFPVPSSSMHMQMAYRKYALSLYICKSLQWRHNEHNGISDHQPHDCLLNRLYKRRWKKTSKFGVTGLWARNSPVTGEFPAQGAINYLSLVSNGQINNIAALFEVMTCCLLDCRPLPETTMALFIDLSITVLLYIVLLYMTIYTDRHIG